MKNFKLQTTPSFFNAPFGNLKDLSESTVAVAGVYCDHYGGGTPGSRFAPRQIRYSNWPEESIFHKRDSEMQVVDIGDLNVFPLEPERNYSILKEQSIKIMSTGARLLSIGGDYSITPALIDGVLTALPGLSLGVIRVSRRLDLSSKEGLLGVSPSRCRTTDKIAESFSSGNKIIALIGVSSFVPVEEISDNCSAFIIPATRLVSEMAIVIDEICIKWGKQFNGFYLSIDADVLEPGPIDTAFLKAYTGVSLECLLSLINKISGLPILAADFTGFLPDIDITGRTGAVIAEEIAFSVVKALRGGEKKCS